MNVPTQITENIDNVAKTVVDTNERILDIMNAGLEPENVSRSPFEEVWLEHASPNHLECQAAQVTNGLLARAQQTPTLSPKAADIGSSGL